MGYSELIKNFNRIRAYMRDFYVYGFKSRDEYKAKSARTYDDERRRVESWLGDYMRFGKSENGKSVFLSIDSRQSASNPLYKALKAKSFTDGDITLHFLLLDILSCAKTPLTVGDIMQELDARLSVLPDARTFDESTLRKKLKEYISEGLVKSSKRGRSLCYELEPPCRLPDLDAVDFFSEAAPLGAVGSFIQDTTPEHESNFLFKHHYITSALDSEVLCTLFDAMRQKRYVQIKATSRRRDGEFENRIVPLKIMISAQNGRQYLMAYRPHSRRIASYRIDYLVSVKLSDECPEFDELRGRLNKMRPHIWGVSTHSQSGARMEHVEFTLRYGEGEEYILRRLEREKRCGTVEVLSPYSCRFSADVYDSSELVPWIRTFICRITSLSFSNKDVEARLKSDMLKMYAMYGVEGGDDNAVQ